MEIALLPVLDVAVLPHPLHVGKARMDAIGRAHVPVRPVVEVPQVEIHPVVPEPREHAVAHRREARLAGGVVDRLHRMAKLNPCTTWSPWSEVKVAAPITYPRSSNTGPPLLPWMIAASVWITR
jgi:hypothetical protein